MAYVHSLVFFISVVVSALISYDVFNDEGASQFLRWYLFLGLISLLLLQFGTYLSLGTTT